MTTILLQCFCQRVWYLSANRDDHSVWHLELVDVGDALECQLLEVQAIRHIMIGGDRFRIAVDDDRLLLIFLECLGCADTGPVEFNRRTDMIGPRAKYNYSIITQCLYIIMLPVVGHVEIVGGRRKLGGERVDLEY